MATGHNDTGFLSCNWNMVELGVTSFPGLSSDLGGKWKAAAGHHEQVGWFAKLQKRGVVWTRKAYRNKSRNKQEVHETPSARDKTSWKSNIIIIMTEPIMLCCIKVPGLISKRSLSDFLLHGEKFSLISCFGRSQRLFFWPLCPSVCLSPRKRPNGTWRETEDEDRATCDFPPFAQAW